MLLESLLVLPIHKTAEEIYDQESNLRIAKIKKQEDESCGGLPLSPSFYREIRYRPWYFNSIIGFLSIESTLGRDLRGDIYLKRRHFPREHAEHRWRRPVEGEEIFLYSDIKSPVERGNNDSYVKAIRCLLQVTQRHIRRDCCGTRRAKVFVPHYGLDCFNWTEIHRRVDGG